MPIGLFFFSPFIKIAHSIKFNMQQTERSGTGIVLPKAQASDSRAKGVVLVTIVRLGPGPADVLA